jgi:ribosomal protein S18 acetylase RimI-like enzyme
VSFVVRVATADDAAGLSGLEQEARDALVESRGGPQLLAEQPAVGDWRGLLADPAARVWVATIDDVPLGFLQLVMPSVGDPVGRVLQVYVHPEARELGFGDEMLAAAIEATRAAGGTTIESFALPGDRDTKNLFERAAVTARKLIVSKRLDR